MRSKLCQNNDCFNPRLRAGGDMSYICDTSDTVVSIHASTREATTYILEMTYLYGVSIHASAREATGGSGIMAAIRFVSIHASAREATCNIQGTPHSSQSFNPRLRAGGDPEDNYKTKLKNVSIHASAREATKFFSVFAFSGYVSIHASAREATFDAIGGPV